MSQTERKIAFVAASTLLCATLEYLIPKPLPFLKLGLANLPLLVVLDLFSFGPFFILLILKSIGQGFVSGTLFSYLFLISLAGTVSSGLAMKGVKSLFKSKVSLIGCSLIGAFVSNLAQLQVASWIVYGKSIWIAAPLMLTIGLFSSLVLGIISERYVQKGTIPALLREDNLKLSLPLMQEREHNTMVAIAAMLCILGILIVEKLLFLVIITVLMYALQLIARRKILLFPPIMLLISMMVLSLFEPNGKVLYTLGSVAFTQGAMELAFIKALRLICLLSASQCISASNLNLSGKTASYIPLTLGYFTILSSSFKATTGTLTERVDQALSRTAQGEEVSSSLTLKANKAISTPLFVSVTTLLLTVAISSRLLF